MQKNFRKNEAVSWKLFAYDLLASLLRLTGELGNFGFWIDGLEIWASQKGSKIKKKLSRVSWRNSAHFDGKFNFFSLLVIFRSNFRFLLSLFGLAPLYRPYRPELVKWPKVGQNGSKVVTRFLTKFPTF